MRCVLPVIGVVLLLLAGCREASVSSVASAVRVEPGSIDFGPVLVGAALERRVEVRNESRVSVELEVGGLAPPFEGPSRVKLAVGQAALVPLRFRPAETGEARASLVLSGGIEEPIEIALSGVGTEPVLAVQELLDFGGVRPGEKALRSLSLRNESLLPLEDLHYELRGPDAEVFGLVDPIREVAAGASEELALSFEANGLEEYWGELVIRPCSTCDEARVQLLGSGVERDLVAEPDVLEFPAVPPGGSSSLVLRVVNRGGYPATLGELRLEGEAFVAGQLLLPVVLGRDEQIEVPLSFVPPGPGDFQGALAFVDEGGAPAIEVPLRGHCGGPILEADPPAIDFGRLPLGERAGARVVVRNVGEEWPVQLGSAMIEGAGGWTVSVPTLPVPVAGNGLPIQVGFSGEVPGPAEATLVLAATEAAWEELRVPLRAEVANDSCQLEVFPSPLQFDATAAVEERCRALRWTNVGSDPCIVWDIQLDPDGFVGFTLSPDEWPGHLEERVLSADGADIRPGDSFFLWVCTRWEAPFVGFVDTSLRFRTSKIGDPPQEVDVRAWCCGVYFERLRFLHARVGETQRRAIRESSGGPYRLLSARLVSGSAPEFTLSVPALPHEFRFDSGIEIVYQPENAGNHLGVVELELEALDAASGAAERLAEPVFVELLGTAVAEEEDR